MNDVNPYNCTKPGNLFVGYERLREHLLNGFRNGNSFAILGGRRCGKTSLLLQVEKDLQTEGLTPFQPLPRYLDFQVFNRLTPDLIFEAIYQLVVQEVEARPWKIGEAGKEYQNFLQHLDAIKSLLNKKYGSDWLVILLVDELDAAILKLPDDQFFQNLRNLLMVSSFNRHFRLIASGVREMASLIFSGSSPLNNLRHKYLSILTSKQAHQLITFGFPQGFDPEIELLLFQLTGRHPYLLQGFLEKLCETKTELNKTIVKSAAVDFFREHSVFQRWVEAFGQAEHAIYQYLLTAPEGKRHLNEIRNSMDSILRPRIDEGLSILSYHGVIDDSDPGEPQIIGTMFRDWYLRNILKQQNSSGQLASLPNTNQIAAPTAPHSSIHIEVNPMIDVKGATSSIHIGLNSADVVSIFQELKAEIAKLPLNERTKMEAQHALDEGVVEVKEPKDGEKPNKEVVKSALEKTTQILTTAGTTAESANTFIEKATKLTPYVGKAAGWLTSLWTQIRPFMP